MSAQDQQNPSGVAGNELFIGVATMVVSIATVLVLVTPAGWAHLLSWIWVMLIVTLVVTTAMVVIKGTPLSARVWNTAMHSTMYCVGVYLVAGLILANKGDNPSVNTPGLFLLIPVALPVILLASFTVSFILLKLFARR